jgi:tetratricopeptide (TPR) repeat protein
MPLSDLFAVTPDSPQYNERDRQGIFYAESWLLTHFLMAGDVPGYTARFGQFTRLLREGQLPESAFTNALQTSLPEMEIQLRRYLQRDQFTPIQFVQCADVSTVKILASRAMTPVETYVRLGDELLRINRLDSAEMYFTRARDLAPASPLPYEALGLLAAERDQHEAALSELREAMQHGQVGFLACYTYARERYQLTADSEGRYTSIKSGLAGEIRGELQRSLTLMPAFAPAHELLGFLEMVQGENLVAAEQQLQLACQLEPENMSFLLSLAQAQIRHKESPAARRTLEPLLLPNAAPKLRAHAEELVREMDRERAIN